MRKRVRSDRAASTVLGYLLSVVGFIVMILFFTLNKITIVGNIVIDLTGGQDSILYRNLGTATWAGVIILILGISIILIEETKEKE